VRSVLLLRIQRELLAVLALLSCQPTIGQQFEPAVIAFDHQQCSAVLAAAFQKNSLCIWSSFNLRTRLGTPAP
jgi:hypothetical protein